MGTTNQEGEPTPMGMTEDVGDAQAEADRWNSKGNAYLAVRDYITAISCFDLALKTHPGSDQEDVFLSNRATAHFRTGRYEAAVEGFRNASRLRPEKHSHFTCLGKVYLRWGRHEAEALEALTESLRLEPTSVAANLAAKAQVALERAHQGAGGGGSFGSPAPSRISSSSPFQSPLSSSAGGSPSVPSDERNVRMLVRRDTNQRGELVAGSGAFVYGGGSNGGIVSGAKGERKGTPPAGNTRNNAHVHRGEGGDEREFQEEEAEAVVEPAVAAAASTRRHSRGSSTAPVDFETGGNGGIVGHRRASKSVEVNPSGGGGGGVFGRGRGRGAPRPAAEASAAAAAVTVAVKEEERAQAPPPPDGEREKPSSSSTLSSSLWAADSPKKEAVGDGGGGGNDSWGVDRFMSRLNIFSGRAEATSQAGGAATRDRSSGGSSRSPQGGEGAGSGPVATTTSTTTPAESVSDSGPKSVSGSGSKSVSDSGLKSVSPSKAPTMVIATRARVAAKKVVPRGTRPMAQIAPLGRASPTTEAAAVLPPRTTPPDATKKSRASRTGAGTASSRPPFRAAPTRTTSAAAAAATTVDPSRFLAGSRVREMEGGGTGGGENGSDNDDDDDDDAFFSTALEAVAKAVHRLNPNDPAAPGSSAAEAAIEAAAAPVKWGKEAIAERENRRRGGPDGGRSATTAAAADQEEEDPDDSLMPPSLGPLGSSDKFTRGPLAARGGGRGGGGAGGGGSDGSGGGGRGGGYRSANAREQQQQEQQHLFSGRLDTGADEEYVSETKITASLVDGSRGSPARLAAQRAGLRRRMSSGSGGIGGGGDSGRGAGGGGEVRDGAGRGRVEPASAPAAVAAAAALAGVEAAAAAAAAVAAAEAAAAAAAERRRMRAFAFRRSVSAAEASSSVFADEDPVSKDDGYYRRRGSWAHARMRSEDVVGNGVRRRSGGGSGFWYGACGPCRPDRDEEDGWGSGWGGGGGGGSGRDGDRVSSQVALSSTRHPDGEVFLDNDEEEWGQTAPTGRYWRLRWPGRHRYATVGACLESPAVMRVGSDYNFRSRASLLGSSDRESDARDGDGDGPSDNGSGSDHATGNASVNTNPKVFFSTSSTKSSPPAMVHVPGTERRQTHRRNVTLPAGGHQPTAIDRTATRIRPSSGGRRSSKDGASGGGGGKRLRRWVNERLSGGGGVPTEEAVRSWIIAVLGPRALSVVNGGEGGRVVSLAEGLKDGRVLVRLAHAVGGARTAGMGEELEATVPMLQLVNVHAFLAAARAIGVPEKNLFHPKDHVMTPTSGPCSPAVLKCLLALSDAVRRNACTDPPGDFYDGPLLGEGGRRAVRAESGGGGVGGVSLVAGRGSKTSRPEGRRGWGCRSSSGNVSSNDSGIGSGTSFDSGNSGGNGNGNPNSNSYGSGSGNGGGNGSGVGSTIDNGGVNLSPMATEKAEDVGEETPTSPDSTLSGVGSIGQGA